MAEITDIYPSELLRSAHRSQPQRRRRYLIDTDYQFRIAGEFSLIILVGVALGLINAYFAVTFFRFDSVDLVRQGLWDPSMDALMWAYSAIVVFVSMLAILLLSILFSHRIVGPSRKLVAGLKRVASGDLTTRIRLRRTDHLQELALELNQLVDHWSTTARLLDGRAQSLRLKAEQQGDAAILRELDALDELLSRHLKTGMSINRANLSERL